MAVEVKPIKIVLLGNSGVGKCKRGMYNDDQDRQKRGFVGSIVESKGKV